MREIRLAALGAHLPPAQVRGIAWSVARAVGATVASVYEPGATPNFHAAVLHEPQPWGTFRRLYLLYSRDYDAWALAMPRDPESGPPPLGWTHLYEPYFLDHEGIIAAMQDFHGIALWSAYDLSLPVPQDVPQRAPNDVAYWRPQRIGDALFNWWD